MARTRKVSHALDALLLDDDTSLREAAALLAEAARLDRRDLAAARATLQHVLEENPRHERAKVLLSLVSP